MDLDVALSVLLIVSAASYLLLGARLVTSKREIASVPIGILFILIGIWVLGGAIELLSDTFVFFSLGRTGHFVGTSLVPVVVYVCFREYIGSETALRTLILLMIIPLLSITLAATNVQHELMWYAPFANETGVFLTRPDRWGKWFLFVHLPFSYAVVATAIMSLLVHSSAVAPAHRRQLFLIVVGCAAPLLAIAAYDLGYGPNTISFVPLVFAAMLPIYTWLIYGEQIIMFTPLAYETVFQNMQDPVVVVDEQRRVIGLNHTAESLLDIKESAAFREPLVNILGDGAPEVFAALNSGKPQKMLTSTGRFLHVQVSPITKNRNSARGGQVIIFRDVSDVEDAQAEVRDSEELMRTLIDHTVNGIVRFRWVNEDDGTKVLRSIFANAAAEQFLGENVDSLVDCTAHDVLRIATSGMDKDAVDDILEQFDNAVSHGADFETEVHNRSIGIGRYLRMICKPVGDDITATFVDIADSKAKERHMETIATSDTLTHVLNRRGFERDATRRLSNSPDDAIGALLFIDLNDFKRINDKYGHDVGDQILMIAAERLSSSLRPSDIIGRPGGDEFVALIPDVTAKIVEKLARRLALRLEEPYPVGLLKLNCAASIGLAMYPEHANTLTGLLREADRAMYRAKARSRDGPDTGGHKLLEKAV